MAMARKIRMKIHLHKVTQIKCHFQYFRSILRRGLTHFVRLPLEINSICVKGFCPLIFYKESSFKDTAHKMYFV